MSMEAEECTLFWVVTRQRLMKTWKTMCAAVHRFVECVDTRTWNCLLPVYTIYKSSVNPITNPNLVTELWAVTPSYLLGGYRRFGAACCLCLQDWRV
jgi:hypothetical protein